jgi:hypothetical protein
MSGGCVLWCAIAALAALVACGGETASPSASSATPTPTGPATANVTFTGDAALGVALANAQVECEYPTLQGLSISVTGVPQGQPANSIFVRLTIRDGADMIRIATGSSTHYRERDFAGTGTTGFDVHRGVQLSGQLNDTTPTGTNKGTLGAITSVTGSVSCGNQTAGTSTIRVTGDTAEGPIDVSLNPVKVVCSSGSSGMFVSVLGLTTVPGAPTLMIIGLGRTSLSVAEDEQVSATKTTTLYYSAQGQVGVNETSTGGQVNGNVNEAASSAVGGTQHTVHLQGDATCGATTTY